jgi:hypothetical protein
MTQCDRSSSGMPAEYPRNDNVCRACGAVLFSRALDPRSGSGVGYGGIPLVTIPTQAGIQSQDNTPPMIAPTAVGRPQTAHSGGVRRLLLRHAYGELCRWPIGRNDDWV